MSGFLLKREFFNTLLERIHTMSFSVINPATEQIITHLTEDTQESVQGKYLEARRAFSQWKNTTLQERARVIEEFSKLIQKRTESLAKILTQEMGKPIASLERKSKLWVSELIFLTTHCKTTRTTMVMEQDSMTEIISYEPLGVIGNISAWNYPYFVGGNVFVPALLCGNCILYKPSEYASLTGLAIAKLFEEASLLSGVFQPLLGHGNVGGWLLEQPIDGIFFTGSYLTGKKIAEKVGGKMIKVQLELGGKDPAYVHNDVDIAVAASSLAEGCFYNNGQSCCAVERIYTHASIHDIFLDEFIQGNKVFPVGQSYV